jgi:Flp pilus assembly protein TadG
MKLLKDESGQTLVLMACFMGIIALGFLALAIDVGYFFQQKRMAQAAADAAAIAAAEEIGSGNSANAQSVANAIAKMNGMDTTLAKNPAVVQLNTPPSTGSYSGNSSYTEVIVTKPISALFLGAFNSNRNTMTVVARAVGGGSLSSPDCVCLEASSGVGLSLDNGSTIDASNLGISIDSSSSDAVFVTQGASITAAALGTVSTTWNNSSNLSNNVTQGGSISGVTHQIDGITPCAPMLTAPTLPGGITCYPDPVDGYIASNNYTGIYTLPVAGETAVNGTICYQSLSTADAKSVTFTPGYVYYIQGDLADGGGAPVTGNGIEFYVGGNVQMGNGVTTNLSPLSVSGVQQPLFYIAGTQVTIAGGNSSNYSGLVYAPNAAVLLNNGSTTNSSMGLVAQTLSMAGGGKLSCTASQNLGTVNISSSAKVME